MLRAPGSPLQTSLWCLRVSRPVLVKATEQATSLTGALHCYLASCQAAELEQTTSLCNTHQQSASSTQKHGQGQPLATMKLPNHLGCSSYEACTTHRDEQGAENSFHIKSSAAPAAHTVKVHSIQTDLAAACYDDIHFSKVRAEEKFP